MENIRRLCGGLPAMTIGRRLFVGWIFWIALRGALCHDVWYVSHSGNDSNDCWHRDTPCKTIRFTVPKTQPDDVINVESDGTPYDDEVSDIEYIHINHSLVLKSSNNSNRACIVYTPHKFKLFQVTTPPNATNATHLVMQGIHITFGWTNSSASNATDTGVNIVHNAHLSMIDCEMQVNHVIIQQPGEWASMCNDTQVDIINSNFYHIGSTKPFTAGINLEGCKSTNLHVTLSHFKASPISMSGSESMIVNVANVTFDGDNASQHASLAVELASFGGNVTLTDCVFADHCSSRQSPLEVNFTARPELPSNVNLYRVHFLNNYNTRASGGAASFRASNTSHGRTKAKINMTDCVFLGNSASPRNSEKGGALYMESISYVVIDGCNFFNNFAPFGGAIYLIHSTDVTITRSHFQQNSARDDKYYHAMTMGGAINIFNSSILINGSKFINNEANSKGSHLYADGHPQLTVMHNEFVESRDITGAYSADMVHISGTPDPVPNQTHTRADVNIKHNLLNVSWRFGFSPLLMSEERSYIRHNVYACPLGHNVNYSVHNTVFTDLFIYDRLLVLCDSCSFGSYSSMSNIWSKDLDYIPRYNEHCNPCPRHAECQFGQIWPQYNYWIDFNMNTSAEDIGVYICLTGLCTGNSSGKIGTADHACAQHRTGALCSFCQSNYTPSMSSHDCIPTDNCISQSTVWVVMATFCVLYITLLISMIWLWKLELINKSKKHKREGMEENDVRYSPTICNLLSLTADHVPSINISNSGDGDVDDNSVSTPPHIVLPAVPSEHDVVKENQLTFPVIFLLICMYYQLLPLIFFPITGPFSVHSVVINSVIQLFSFQPMFSGVLNTACELFSLGGKSEFLLQFAMTGMLITMVCVLWLAFSLLRVCLIRRPLDETPRRWLRRVSSACHYLCACFCWLVVSCYIPLLHSAFYLIHCRPFRGHSVLTSDITTTCLTSWQIVVIVVIITCLAPLPLALILAAQTRHKDLTGSKLVLMGALPLVFVVWYYGTLRNRNNTNPSETSPLLRSPRSEHELMYGTVFYSMLLVPFSTNNSDSDSKCRTKPQSGIAVIMIKCFVLVSFGTMLAHLPVLRAFSVAIIILVFLMTHVTTDRHLCRGVQEAVTLGLFCLTILAFLNIFCATLYEFGFNNADDPLQVLVTLCETAYIIAVAVPVTILACVALLVLVFGIIYLPLAALNMRQTQT